MRREYDHKGVTGWTAKLSDGSVAGESDGIKWGDVKDKVVGLSLSRRGVEIVLPDDQAKYIEGHSGTCPIGGGDVRVTSRTVGFVTPSGDMVTLRLPEGADRIIVEVEKCRQP